MSSPILIATRKSPLALKQTEMVRERLSRKLPDEVFEELRLSTKVDERLSWSLEKRGGIGLFTKELENALLEGRAEIAVHSSKDMPTTCPEGLVVAGYMPRARVNDVMVHRNETPQPKTVATSSPRRRAQLEVMYPGLDWTTIRGNVGTRLKKIAEGACDASLLAAAGLDRLEIESYESLSFVELSVEDMVPAPGQAAIAIQCRTEDLEKYTDLFCDTTKLAVTLEKAFLQRLGSGCQVPVGAYFVDGLFRIYHPEIGYKAYELEISSIEDVEPSLDPIISELGIS